MLIGAAPPGTSNGPAAQARRQAQAWGTPPFTFDFSAGVSARDLVRQMMVPPSFLVDTLIPDGLTILAAPAKSYKSYFSLSLALATIGEGEWLDTLPGERDRQRGVFRAGIAADATAQPPAPALSRFYA